MIDAPNADALKQIVIYIDGNTHCRTIVRQIRTVNLGLITQPQRNLVAQRREATP